MHDPLPYFLLLSSCLSVSLREHVQMGRPYGLVLPYFLLLSSCLSVSLREHVQMGRPYGFGSAFIVHFMFSTALFPIKE